MIRTFGRWLSSVFIAYVVVSSVRLHSPTLANEANEAAVDANGARLLLRENLKYQSEMVQKLGGSFQTDSVSETTRIGSDKVEFKRQIAVYNLLKDSYDLRIRSWEGNSLNGLEDDPGERIPAIRNIWHDGLHYTHNQYQRTDLDRQHSVFVNKDRDEVYRYHSINYAAAPLSGYYANDPRPVAEVMLEADELRLVGQETIDRRPVSVVEAKSRDGIYKIWIDTERSYAIVQAEVKKLASEGHNYSGRNLSQQHTQIVSPSGTKEISTVDRVTFKLDAVRLEEVYPGLWLPVEAEIDREFYYSNGEVYQSAIHPIRTQVSIQPDFVSLAAFELDVPYDTEVFVMWAPGIDYVWRHGQPVLAVDENAINAIDEFIKQEVHSDKSLGEPIVQDQEASAEVADNSVSIGLQKRPSLVQPYIWWILMAGVVLFIAPFLLKRVFSGT